MTVIAFLVITAYLMMFYFTLDYNLPKESLMLPLFLRSFGYVIIAICFITALSRVPFENFFEAVSVQAFVSAAFGGLLGRVLTIVMKKNAVHLGATLDHVNLLANHLPLGELYGALHQQALMVSMKELYGWLTLVSLFCLFLFLINENSARPFHALHPRYRLIRRAIKHDLRMRKLWKR